MLQAYPQTQASGAVANGEGSRIFSRNISLDELPPRQKEVARLACAGLRNKEIAIRTGITEATVKVHLKSVYRQVGVNSRTGLLGVFGVPNVTAADMEVDKADVAFLDFIAAGARNEEIAERMHTDDAWVKARVRTLTSRLGVSNRTQLGAWWLVKQGKALPDQVGALVVGWDGDRLDTLKMLAHSGVGIGVIRNALMASITDVAEGLLLLVRTKDAA